MNTISPAALKEAAKQLPTSPQIFGKLGKALKDPDTDLDQIANLVHADSSLTTQVLRLSNSAVYSGGSSVDTLDEAINRIGFRELFKLVGMAAASQVFSERNSTYNIDGSLLWENSLACGLAMERLARKAGLDDQEAYTIGLLRSMGKMVIDSCIKSDPDYPAYPANSSMPLIEWEEANFGITNPIVAGFLLGSWNFPVETSNTIQYQYRPEKAPTPDAMVYLLNLSNYLANQLGKPLPGESSYWKLTDDRLSATRVTADDIDEVAEQVDQTLAQVISSVSA